MSIRSISLKTFLTALVLAFVSVPIFGVTGWFENGGPWVSIYFTMLGAILVSGILVWAIVSIWSQNLD